jgi:hypothetical protein
MKNKWFLIGFFISSSFLIQAQLPVLNQSFQTASVKTNKNLLTVSTGKMQRTWQWTGKGLATISVKNLETGKEWKSDKKSNY